MYSSFKWKNASVLTFLQLPLRKYISAPSQRPEVSPLPSVFTPKPAISRQKAAFRQQEAPDDQQEPLNFCPEPPVDCPEPPVDCPEPPVDCPEPAIFRCRKCRKCNLFFVCPIDNFVCNYMTDVQRDISLQTSCCRS